MSHGSFPGSKLLVQLFRQLTKPTSKRIVEYAKTRPKFRQYFLLTPGRFYHKLEINLQRLKKPSILDVKKEKARPIPQIKDEAAVELGSQLMIEIVIFILMTIILILDQIRSTLKSGREEKRRREEFEELERQKIEAQARVEMLAHEIELARELRLELLRETQRED